MDWTKVRAGEPIESAIIAWREWRYRLRPLRLVSLSFDIPWIPGVPNESNPDVPFHNGVYALKERPERWGWSRIESAGWHDGWVLGRVALWGVCWNHERGYRSQYARPVAFDEARGDECERALEMLRVRFRV